MNDAAARLPSMPHRVVSLPRDKLVLMGQRSIQFARAHRGRKTACSPAIAFTPL
jgi:hypothetical protein